MYTADVLWMLNRTKFLIIIDKEQERTKLFNDFYNFAGLTRMYTVFVNIKHIFQLCVIYEWRVVALKSVPKSLRVLRRTFLSFHTINAWAWLV